MPMKNYSTFIIFIRKTCFNQAFNAKCSIVMSENEFKDLERQGTSPSADTIRKIMEFSNTYDVLDTKSAGQIEMNLN